MNHRIVAVAAALSFSLVSGCATSPAAVRQETQKTMHASGTFDVKTIPQKPADGEEASISRLLLDKQFHGDLDAASKGQMIATQGAVQGSAGYVAIERVTGTLQGRTGSFALQHTGTMTRGEPSLSITVIPDSGTGQLTGVSGTMNIIIAEGKHSYEFDYTLP
jgi:hypothetical protein